MTAPRAQASVNVAAIERNCARLRADLRSGAELCAVVKADGYGHGAEQSARAALAGGAAWLAVASAAVMIALGLPFLGIKFTGVDASVLPKSASARQVSDALETEFPPHRTSPVYLAVSAPASAGAALHGYAQHLGALDAGLSEFQ